MTSFYICLIPFFSYIFYKRMAFIRADIKEGNRSKLKADIFILSLCILLMIGIVLVYETA